MKFYLCHTPEGRKRLVTRQDEAKKLDKNAEPIDIPVDQAGIKQGYEELFDKIFDLEQAAKDLLPERAMSETTKALVNPPKPKAPNPDDGADAIIDWMFDHATNSQVCDVFLGLSSRFSDLIKRERADAQEA